MVKISDYKVWRIIGWKKWHKKKNTRLGERIRKIFSTRRVFHSAGMCLLEAEGFYPCGQVGFAGVGIEYLAVQEFGTGAARRKFFIGLTHVATARCGKSIAITPCAAEHPMSFKVPDRLLTDGQCRMMINGIQFIQVLLEANGLVAGKDHQFKGRYDAEKNAVIISLEKDEQSALSPQKCTT